jgi:hypothetical protein
VAVGIVVLVPHDDHDVSASDRGSLSSEQYLAAASIARTAIAKQHATVSTAVATVVQGKVSRPNLPAACTSGELLVIHLVGEFPEVDVGGFVGGRVSSGPDTWLTLKADATTGEACLEGVRLGRFTRPAGAADLAPAL